MQTFMIFLVVWSFHFLIEYMEDQETPIEVYGPHDPYWMLAWRSLFPTIMWTALYVGIMYAIKW